MSIFRQTNDGDLDITGGTITLVEGPEETAHRMRNRLFSVQGEWFANALVGIPYFELVFIKNPDLDVIRTVFTQAFNSLPGVLRVAKIDLSVDRDSRDLVVGIEVSHDSGATIVGGSGTPFVVEEY